MMLWSCWLLLTPLLFVMSRPKDAVVSVPWQGHWAKQWMIHWRQCFYSRRLCCCWYCQRVHLMRCLTWWSMSRENPESSLSPLPLSAPHSLPQYWLVLFPFLGQRYVRTHRIRSCRQQNHNQNLEGHLVTARCLIVLGLVQNWLDDSNEEHKILRKVQGSISEIVIQQDQATQAHVHVRMHTQIRTHESDIRMTN